MDEIIWNNENLSPVKWQIYLDRLVGLVAMRDEGEELEMTATVLGSFGKLCTFSAAPSQHAIAHLINQSINQSVLST